MSLYFGTPAFLPLGEYDTVWPEVTVMRNILESIYLGSEAISARAFKPATRYARLMEDASQLEEKLKAALTDETRPMFIRFAEVSSEIGSISSLEDFKAGVQLGVSFILAALYDDSSCFQSIDRQEDK